MVRPKHRLTVSGTDLITILRCFLSFKTVVTSRNIIVFKIKIPSQKTVIRVVHVLWYLVPLADVLRVPDSIALLLGPAGLLTSDSGTRPHIEPNHTKANLLTTPASNHPILHALFLVSWRMRVGWRFCVGGRRRRHVASSVLCHRCRLCFTRLAATSDHLTIEHRVFEVLGLGASTGPAIA